MIAGAVLARIEDVPDKGAIVRDVGEGAQRVSLLLTRDGERISAFQNMCPHARFPLERFDGVVIVQEGRYLVCAAHGASFCLRTGAHAGGPGRGGLAPAPIRLDRGRIIAA